MHHIRHLTCLLTCLLALTLFAGCASAPPAPIRFYQLSVLPASSSGNVTADTIGIGPIRWPEYLDKRGLMTRLDANTLKASDNERWAEALEQNFARALREDLSSLYGSAQFIAYPWNIAHPPARSISIEVLQLDSDTQGKTVLRARWQVSGGKVAAQLGEWQVQAKGSTPAAVVAAQSEAVAAMARDIAGSLQ